MNKCYTTFFIIYFSANLKGWIIFPSFKSTKWKRHSDHSIYRQEGSTEQSLNIKQLKQKKWKAIHYCNSLSLEYPWQFHFKMKTWFQTKWLQYFLWKQTQMQLATLSIFMLFAYIPIFSKAETCISLKCIFYISAAVHKCSGRWGIRALVRFGCPTGRHYWLLLTTSISFQSNVQ